MEYASVLAGERWSDHPACTHPAVASLARLVNDCTSDDARSQLVPWIPSVVGIAGRGAITTIVVAIYAASAALPVASEARQRALAAGLLRSVEIIEDHDDRALEVAREALEFSPGATRWANDFIALGGHFPLRDLDRMCEAIIRTSVVGIAEACIEDQDARLRALLVTVIETSRDAVEPVDAPKVDDAPVDAATEAPRESRLQSA
jgi:hypothetical protein